MTHNHPHFPYDPVIEAYKKDIDRTLIRENLKLTHEERLLRLFDFQQFVEELRTAGRELRGGRVTPPGQLLKALANGKVEFLAIGVVAAAVYGAVRIEMLVEIAYRQTTENAGRLADSLNPFNPHSRDIPASTPFQWSADTILSGLNFKLSTSLGPIDLFGEVTGGGVYEDLVHHSVPISAFGVSFLCPKLEKLIEINHATARPRDLEATAELEAILEQMGEGEQD